MKSSEIIPLAHLIRESDDEYGLRHTPLGPILQDGHHNLDSEVRLSCKGAEIKDHYSEIKDQYSIVIVAHLFPAVLELSPTPR